MNHSRYDLAAVFRACLKESDLGNRCECCGASPAKACNLVDRTAVLCERCYVEDAKLQFDHFRG